MPASARGAWLAEQEAPTHVKEEVERLLGQSSSTFSAEGVSPVAPAASLADGEVLLNRFRVVKRLGHGGMGEVYLARDEWVGQQVALKTVRSHLANDPSLVARLEREVKAGRSIHHDNVCRMFDLHRHPESGLAWLTMQLLEGPTLASRLESGPLTGPEIEDIAGGLADGLDAIHRAGIVHRDLKPANLFLVPHPVITDFGLALETERPVTETLSLYGPDAIVGTPAYMAPEQLLGHAVTKAADIHAFGVVLYEMFTGERPFPGKTPLAVALRRLSEEPLPTHRSIPEHWMRTIHCCLARDPALRPSSARAALMMEDSPAVQGIPRRRWIAGALTAGSAVAVIGGGVYWQNRPHPMSEEALRHFKLGVEYGQRTSSREILLAIREFESTVRLAPGDGLAWAHLADAYCTAANYVAMPGAEARRKAEAAARRAVAIDSSLALAQSSLAYVLATDRHRWGQAGAYFQRAIATNGREGVLRARYAGYLGRRGRFQEAVDMAKSAVALEPAQFRFQMQMATELFRAKRFKELVTHMEAFVELHSTRSDAYLTLARAREWLGQYDAAADAISTAGRLFPEADLTAYQATLSAARDRRDEAILLADSYLAKWTQGQQESNQAVSVEASLRRTENVFMIIEKGLERDDDTVLAIPSNPYVGYLQQDSRLLSFRRSLGLPLDLG